MVGTVRTVRGVGGRNSRSSGQSNNDSLELHFGTSKKKNFAGLGTARLFIPGKILWSVLRTSRLLTPHMHVATLPFWEKVAPNWMRKLRSHLNLFFLFRETFLTHANIAVTVSIVSLALDTSTLLPSVLTPEPKVAATKAL